MRDGTTTVDSDSVEEISRTAMVLIVEDEPAIRDALTELLVEEGYTVAAAENGRDALDYLGTALSLPKIMLVDMMMPVMDGSELLNQLTDDVFAAIPVVVITAGDRPFLKTVVSRIPVTIIHKPFNRRTILQIVGAACGRSSLPRLSAAPRYGGR